MTASAASRPVIFWFRQDLRLSDLPGLLAAIATGQPLITCFVHDTESAGQWAPGAASNWWLQRSLQALARDIAGMGGDLLVLSGCTRSVLAALLDQTDASAIYCSRHYEPWAATLESDLRAFCADRAVEFKRYPGVLLFEPEQVSTGEGNGYKVFTPFWKACRRLPEPSTPLSRPAALNGFTEELRNTRKLTEFEVQPRPTPAWAAHWNDYWHPGAAGAAQSVDAFLATGVTNYDEGRNHPALEATSRLSPHLHFGEISPRQVWHRVRWEQAQHPQLDHQVEKFLSELGWREFSHHLLTHFPHIPEQPFKANFSRFPWAGGKGLLRAWQQGQTGYPIVDAGMRELWQTGFMHNRVRMIVASFLTKHLLIDWRQGEAWFWDTLVDADLANNACGWQWVAGSGADASPYFRIFNPTLQGQKFDRQGEYVRRWVPELSRLPSKYLHEPCMAPQDVLDGAGVVLGDHYPNPIVDHKFARQAALDAYAGIRQAV